MSDPITDTKRMAESHGLQFDDRGGGHVQIRGNGMLVNYYPLSKRRTAYCPDSGERLTNCTPFNACKLAMKGNGKAKDIRPKAHRKPSKQGPSKEDVKPSHTNPAGLRHFHDSDVPPWDESLGDFTYLSNSDRLRAKACQIEAEAMGLRAHAERMEESA